MRLVILFVSVTLSLMLVGITRAQTTYTYTEYEIKLSGIAGDTIGLLSWPKDFLSGGCNYRFANIEAKHSNDYISVNDIISFVPKNQVVFYDTVKYSHYNSDGCYPMEIRKKIFITVNVSDSVTTTRLISPNIIMPIDTFDNQYLSKKIGAFFSMYNNVTDFATFSNWQQVISDSAKLSFKIDTAGTESSSYLMEPFTRKRQLNFTFTTELTPIETERVFSAKLLTTVTTAEKDSVYENALLFRFPPLQPKGVHGMSGEDVLTPSISPNPTTLNSTLLFAHNGSEAISIELYDALGIKRMILADGIYEGGVHTIPLDTKDLPQGSYFVRLQTSGQVVTKKLIVR